MSSTNGISGDIDEVCCPGLAEILEKECTKCFAKRDINENTGVCPLYRLIVDSSKNILLRFAIESKMLSATHTYKVYNRTYPLIFASIKNLEAFKIFIEHGALAERDIAEKTIRQLVYGNDDTLFYEALLPVFNTLEWKFTTPYTSIYDNYISENVSVGESNDITINSNMLLFGVRSAKKNFVEFLIKNKQDITIRDINGRTSLIHAVTIRNSQMVEMLLTLPNLFGRDSNEDSNEVFEAFKKVVDNRGCDAAYYAIKSNDMIICQMLMPFDYNKKYDGGITLLHVAACGSNDVFKFLLRNGAKMTKDNKGQTPYDVAVANRKVSTIEIIVNEAQYFDIIIN